MIIYRNKYIPVQGFEAFFFCGILFIRGNVKIDDVTMNHESIHSKQWIECGVAALIVLSPLILIGLWWLWLLISVFAFYILYVIEWGIRLTSYTTRHISRKLRDKYRKYNPHLAYKKITFEQEAHKNERTLEYLKSRKRFAWIKYLK